MLPFEQESDAESERSLLTEESWSDVTMYGQKLSTFKEMFFATYGFEDDPDLIDGWIIEAVRGGKFANIKFMHKNYRASFNRTIDEDDSEYLLLQTLATLPRIIRPGGATDYEDAAINTINSSYYTYHHNWDAPLFGLSVNMLPVSIVRIIVAEWPEVARTVCPSGLGHALHKACLYGYRKDVLAAIYGATLLR